MIKVMIWTCKGKSFEIYQDNDNQYWGIPSAYFDGGVLIYPFNSVDGHRSESLEACMDTIRKEITINELISKGVDRHVATVSVMMNMTVAQAIKYCKNERFSI